MKTYDSGYSHDLERIITESYLIEQIIAKLASIFVMIIIITINFCERVQH